MILTRRSNVCALLARQPRAEVVEETSIIVCRSSHVSGLQSERWRPSLLLTTAPPPLRAKPTRAPWRHPKNPSWIHLLPQLHWLLHFQSTKSRAHPAPARARNCTAGGNAPQLAVWKSSHLGRGAAQCQTRARWATLQWSHPGPGGVGGTNKRSRPHSWPTASPGTTNSTRLPLTRLNRRETTSTKHFRNSMACEQQSCLHRTGRTFPHKCWRESLQCCNTLQPEYLRKIGNRVSPWLGFLGKPSTSRKNARKPQPPLLLKEVSQYTSHLYCNMPPICIAVLLLPVGCKEREILSVLLPFVSQYAFHLYCNTLPICIAVLLGKSWWLWSPGCSPLVPHQYACHVPLCMRCAFHLYDTYLVINMITSVFICFSKQVSEYCNYKCTF